MMFYSCSQMVGLPVRVSLEYQMVLFCPFCFLFLSSFLFFFFGYKIAFRDDWNGINLLKPLPRGGGGG